MFLLRELHDMKKGKTKNLDIVLYIQRSGNNDKFVNDYFSGNHITEGFTIVRSRDEMCFMMGLLYTNSSKIAYVSESKNSISQGLFNLMNPSSKEKSKTFKHVRIKEFLKNNDRTWFLKLFQLILPEAIDLNKEPYISQPIGCK